MPPSTLDRPRTRANPKDWVVVVQGKQPTGPSATHSSRPSLTAAAATAVLVPPRRRAPTTQAFAPARFLPVGLPTKLPSIPKGVGQALLLVALIVVTAGGPMLAFGQSPSVALGIKAPQFVAYTGTSPENVRFTLKDGWSQTAVVPGGLLMDWREGQGDQALRLTMGNPLSEPVIEKMSEDGTRIEEIRYQGSWPGIDTVLKVQAGGFAIHHLVEPGVDPSAIQLEYAGATALKIDEAGRLVVEAARGTWRSSAPESWQDGPNGREPVESHFNLLGGNFFGFSLGAYDPSRPLVVDPPSERIE